MASTPLANIDNHTGRGGVPFPNLCNIYGTIIPESVFVGPFVEIQKNCTIGDNVRIQSHCFVCENVHIGPNTFVAHGVMFTNDKFTTDQCDDSAFVPLRTNVGAGVRIGANCTILPINIGDGAVIGAGSVVTRDVPEGAVVAGNPAKIMSSRGAVERSPNTRLIPIASAAPPKPNQPLVDLTVVNKSHQQPFHDTLQRVLDSGRYTLGEETKAFESELGTFMGGGGDIIAVGSGTAALELVFQEIGVGPGTDVIVQSNAFVASVYPLVRSGCRIVITDVREDGTMDLEDVAAKITPATRAVLVVHLYGDVAADMVKLSSICAAAGYYGGSCLLVEDCAQALGSYYQGKMVGTFGDFACFSFYPTKNLGGIGEGGAIRCTNVDRAARLRKTRNLGMGRRYDYELLGQNARMDELQAGFLRTKLKSFWANLTSKILLEQLYDNLLSKSNLLRRFISRFNGENESSHSLHLLVYRVKGPAGTRDFLMEYLIQHHGIETLVHYPIPFHRSTAITSKRFCQYTNEELMVGQTTTSDELAVELISLPLYSGMTQSEVERVCSAILHFESAMK